MWGHPFKRHLSREKSIPTVRGVSSSPSGVRIGAGGAGGQIFILDFAIAKGMASGRIGLKSLFFAIGKFLGENKTVLKIA